MPAALGWLCSACSTRMCFDVCGCAFTSALSDSAVVAEVGIDVEDATGRADRGFQAGSEKRA
eukprot:6335238-Alexandrium_andersonii.AAC.1